MGKGGGALKVCMIRAMGKARLGSSTLSPALTNTQNQTRVLAGLFTTLTLSVYSLAPGHVSL